MFEQSNGRMELESVFLAIGVVCGLSGVSTGVTYTCMPPRKPWECNWPPAWSPTAGMLSNFKDNRIFNG